MNRNVLVLAGGKGTRMEVEKPKVLVELKNKPMIEYVVNVVEKIGLKPIVIIGYRGKEVQNFLLDQVEYIWQCEQKGTGHAVSMAKNKLVDFGGSVLILYGDHPLIKQETMERIFEVQEEQDVVLTMATTIVDDFIGDFELFNNYGRVLRDSAAETISPHVTGQAGKIVAIREAKDCSDDELIIKEVNPGYYCFNSEWLWQNIEKLQNHNAQGEYYLTDLVEMAVRQGQKIETVEIDPVQCLGANTKEQLKNLEKFL